MTTRYSPLLRFLTFGLFPSDQSLQQITLVRVPTNWLFLCKLTLYHSCSRLWPCSRIQSVYLQTLVYKLCLVRKLEYPHSLSSFRSGQKVRKSEGYMKAGRRGLTAMSQVCLLNGNLSYRGEQITCKYKQYKYNRKYEKHLLKYKQYKYNQCDH